MYGNYDYYVWHLLVRTLHIYTLGITLESLIQNFITWESTWTERGQLEESTIKHDYPSAGYSANLLQGDNRFDNGIFGGGPEGGDHLCVVTDLLHPDEDAVMRTIFQRLSHLK